MTLTPEEPTRWLIAGLGNPEKKYAANRHNVGFHVLDRLAAQTGVSITDRRFQGWFGKATVDAARHAAPQADHIHERQRRRRSGSGALL